jgi:hypothetical membrane protein
MRVCHKRPLKVTECSIKPLIGANDLTVLMCCNLAIQFILIFPINFRPHTHCSLLTYFSKPRSFLIRSAVVDAFLFIIFIVVISLSGEFCRVSVYRWKHSVSLSRPTSRETNMFDRSLHESTS